MPPLPVLHNSLVHPVARLQRNVQLVTQFTHEADSEDAHELAVRLHQLRGREGEHLVGEILVHDVLQYFLTVKEATLPYVARDITEGLEFQFGEKVYSLYSHLLGPWSERIPICGVASCKLTLKPFSAIIRRMCAHVWYDDRPPETGNLLFLLSFNNLNKI